MILRLLIRCSVKSLGTVNPFDMSIILSAINIVSIIVTLLIIDRVGRR